MRALPVTFFLAAACLAACSDDSLSGSTAGTTTSESTGTGGTTSTTGTGGTTSTGGTGGSGAGGTGGTGAGGTSTGGSATGGTGTGGSAAGGTGGTTGTGGTGGAGGTGGTTGTGGTGGGETGTLLVVAGGLPDSLAVVATRSGGSGWTTANINLQFKEASLAPLPEGGALGAFRRLSNNPPMGDDELYRGAWTPGAGFGAVTSMGTFAKEGPALAPHGVATMLTALDLQNEHVCAQYESGAFAPLGAIPAGQPGSQAFGPSGSVLAAYGVAGVYASYSGDDEQLYMNDKPGPGSVWGPSLQVPSSPVVNAHRPALAVDADADLHLFYVRKSDGRICTVKLITPQNAWTTEEAIHPDAITGQSPAAARLPDGDLVVAWHGFDNNGIYFSRRNAGVWSAPVTVEEPATPSSGPVVVTGLGGADAEILYTVGGALRWSRVTGTTATFGDDPGVVNVKTLAALVVP